MASLAAAVGAVITTPVSQSSLLSLSKPSILSPHHRLPLLRPLRLSPSSRLTSRFIIAVSDDDASEDVPALEIDIGGGDGGDEGGFGGGGGGRGPDDSSGEGEEESSKEKKTGGMSMSQKLTLGYAALVGVGGVMGYMKSGSQKSLAAGGVSSLLLYYVYTQLPANPAFASSLGLGVSAALLAVMGSRFKNSGKIFPAGVVSLVSLVMVGGYFHGILRGMHG